MRITNMKGINLRRFQFDFDTTWNAFFLDAKLNIYSRYGGRDEGEPEDRMSKASLLQTMQDVLATHKSAKRTTERQRRPLFQPVDAGVLRPRDIPLLRQSHQGCVHCHQIREYEFLQAAKNGKFSRRLVYDWPLPETLGMQIDHRHGHRILKLREGSPAVRAGMKPGDVIGRINDVPIHSDYDIRWALGRTAAGKPITMQVSRASQPHGKPVRVAIKPQKGWRATDLSWRKSMRSLPLPFGFRGYSLTRSQRRDQKISADALAVRIVSVRGNSLAGDLKLQRKDVIVALGAQKKLRTLAELKSDFLRDYRAGDRVKITVLRDGNRVQLSARFPKWRTDETSVP